MAAAYPAVPVVLLPSLQWGALPHAIIQMGPDVAQFHYSKTYRSAA